MTQEKHVAILVHVPTDLKSAIARRVRDEDTSMNNFIVSTLARHYGVPFEPSDRRGKPAPRGGDVVIRLSPRLKRRLQIDALRHHPSNMSARVLDVLARELGVQLNGVPRNRSPFGGGRRLRWKPEASPRGC